MSRESVLAQGRRRVEASMSETILAGSYTEAVDANLRASRTLDTTRYEGAASIAYLSLNPDEPQAAGQQLSTSDVVAKIPVAAPLLELNDLIVVSASTADTGLIGREYRVKGPPQGGQVTSHRYPVEELT